MKKHTKTKTAVGFLSLLLLAGISISCWSYYFLKDIYSYMPDGEITLDEFKNFDAYKTRDTFGMPSAKYVPVDFYLIVNKKNSHENFAFGSSKREKSQNPSIDDPIKFLHQQLSHNTSKLIDVGDTVILTLYYHNRKEYERQKNIEGQTTRYLRHPNVIGRHVYYIKDQSLVELKREKTMRFKVYPSPAIDQVNVRLDISKSKPGKVTLFNTMGQVLIQEEIHDVTQEKNIQLQAYPSGTYFVQVSFLGENFVKKIIKK